VHLNWLLMSASSWRRLNESTYLLDEPQGDPFSPTNGIDPFDTQALLSSDEDDDDDDEALSLPSAGVANVRGETPDSDLDDEDVDIGEFDWGNADKEVNDFLAELGEDGVYTTDESDNERYSSFLGTRLILVWHQTTRAVLLTNENGSEMADLPAKPPMRTIPILTAYPTTIPTIYVPV